VAVCGQRAGCIRSRSLRFSVVRFLAANAAGLAASYTIPRLVRRRNWQLRVTSRPLVLAITDVAALTCYFALCVVFIR
jgi:hypothetical protein